MTTTVPTVNIDYKINTTSIGIINYVLLVIKNITIIEVS